MTHSFKLSPSDLTFLWDECPRCFYLKVKLGFGRPATPFPSIFTRIDGLMKKHFADKPTQSISLLLPPGRVMPGDGWVESEPIALPGHASHCHIRGKYDTLLEFENGTYGVVDFKTSEAKDEHVAFYARQLHAYAYALEHNAPRAMHLAPITALGLLVVEPDELAVVNGKIGYLGSVTWQPIPLDMNGYLDFLGQVVSLLEQPEPPAPGEKCGFCKYRDSAREMGF